MKTSLWNYIRIDLKRAFLGWRFPISVGVIAIVLWFDINAVHSQVNTDVITHTRYILSDAVLPTVIWVFATLPYADSFCIDMEYKYDFLMVLRGNRFRYLFARVIVTFLSAFSAVLLGYILHMLSYRVFHPFLDLRELESITDQTFFYADRLLRGEYLTYIFLVGLQVAMLAGTLAVTALTISLFLRNQMLVYVFPVIFLQLEDVLVQRMFDMYTGPKLSYNIMTAGVIAFNSVHASWQWAYIQFLLLLIIDIAIIAWKMERRN